MNGLKCSLLKEGCDGSRIPDQSTPGVGIRVANGCGNLPIYVLPPPGVLTDQHDSYGCVLEIIIPNSASYLVSFQIHRNVPDPDRPGIHNVVDIGESPFKAIATPLVVFVMITDKYLMTLDSGHPFPPLAPGLPRPR